MKTIQFKCSVVVRTKEGITEFKAPILATCIYDAGKEFDERCSEKFPGAIFSQRKIIRIE